jgi:spermidine synthase
LRLFRRDTEYSIRLAGFELMNSRVHGSEDELARLALGRLPDRAAPRVLVGGLGIGFTVAAAVAVLPPGGAIEVVELVPVVVDWHREYLADVTGRPLDDARVTVTIADVAHVIGRARGLFDAILLDVDNGPEGLTRRGNDRLYSAAGLAAARHALRNAGILAVWSASADDAFTVCARRGSRWKPRRSARSGVAAEPATPSGSLPGRLEHNPERDPHLEIQSR